MLYLIYLFVFRFLGVDVSKQARQREDHSGICQNLKRRQGDVKQLVFLFPVVAMVTAARCNAAKSAMGEEGVERGKAGLEKTGGKYLN